MDLGSYFSDFSSSRLHDGGYLGSKVTSLDCQLKTTVLMIISELRVCKCCPCRGLLQCAYVFATIIAGWLLFRVNCIFQSSPSFCWLGGLYVRAAVQVAVISHRLHVSVA